MTRTRRALRIAIAVAALGSASSRIPSAAGEPTSRVTTVRIAGAASVVKAQTGSDGVVHALFDAADGPRYASSKDGGVTFGASIPVLDKAPRKPGLMFSAWDLAVGKDGRVHVAMADNAWKLKLPKDEWGFHYAALAPGAKAFSPVRNLNHKPSEGFALAADGRGAVTASFLADKLFAMTSRDDGETFGAGAELDPAWNP